MTGPHACLHVACGLLLTLVRVRVVWAGMQAVLGDFIHRVLDRMKSHVELRVVLGKILSDHAEAEFREFRETILGILDTYVVPSHVVQTTNLCYAGHLALCLTARSRCVNTGMATNRTSSPPPTPSSRRTCTVESRLYTRVWRGRLHHGTTAACHAARPCNPCR